MYIPFCRRVSFRMIWLACLCAALSLMSGYAWASGFPQQGQGNGTPAVSTDYYAADKGTAVNPLTLDACTPQPCSQDASTRNPMRTARTCRFSRAPVGLALAAIGL